MMKLATFAALAGSAAAFAPAPAAKTATSLNAATSSSDRMNGWVPDESKFAWGLPGSIAPVENFDPLGFAEGTPLSLMKRWREAEVHHGRVAMLASLGLLVTEEPIEFHPLFERGEVDIGPAIRHLDELDAAGPYFAIFLALLIGSIEWNRALTGFSAPEGKFEFQQLKDDYYPGDTGFDPLGLKPEGAEEFAEMQTKELQNGRLAMLGAAGMIAQELVNGKEIFVNLGLATDRFDPSSVPIQF
jgi:light-harvesting complex I chlorophyll a/b binding protein 1